mgnify:CR=1 FL=1
MSDQVEVQFYSKWSPAELYGAAVTEKQRKAFEAYIAKENPRVVSEWARWDGTLDQAAVINDRQCARLAQKKTLLGMFQ